MPQKLRVLVVDDSKVVRKAFVRILSEDYDLVEAADGEEAWEKLEQDDEVCAVFTDLNMPHLDGHGLVKRIRGSKDGAINSLPIVLVTSSGEDTEVTKKALTAGATDYVLKPFDSVFLQSKAKAYVKPRDHGVGDNKLASLDPLTKLANRTYFLERGEQDVSAANRHKSDLALILLSIDDFQNLAKQTNEKIIGGIIRKVGTYISSEVRLEDTVARIDKSKFSMLLADANLNAATELAERIRAKVEQKTIKHHETTFKVTISVGVSSLPGDIARTLDMLMLEADRHLASAVKSGGNSVFPAAKQADAEKTAGPLTTSLDEALAMLNRKDNKMSAEQAATSMRHLLPLLEYCDKVLKLKLTEQVEALKKKYGSRS